MALSGLKIYNNASDFTIDQPKYKLGLFECELEVNDEKDIDYAKNGKPLTTFIKRTYKVKIKSLPFLVPTNYTNSFSGNSYNTIEAIYNKSSKATITNAAEESKIGLYTYMKRRRFYHSVQGVFPSAFGDFEGTYKTINSTEDKNYGIIEGTIHLCID